MPEKQETSKLSQEEANIKRTMKFLKLAVAP